MNNPPLPYASIQPSHISLFYKKDYQTVKKQGGDLLADLPHSIKPKRFLQVSAIRKMKRAINWMMELSEPKEIWNEKKNVSFSFRLNFITLTLPALQMHLDTTIKNKCLNNFLTELRKYQSVENYLWRAECQSNGNIHFHVITDTFINLYVLRRIWNRQLKLLGYIEKYKRKFEGLEFNDYCKIVDPHNKMKKEYLLPAYNYGNRTNWSDPNTTDIHSLYNVKNPAAYISKYMTKGESDKGKDGRYELKNRKIEGRKYGVSRKLGKIKGLVEMKCNEIEQLIDYSIYEKKCRKIVEEYYSIVVVRIADWKERFNDLYGRMIKEIIDSVDYVRGGQGKSKYILSG